MTIDLRPESYAAGRWIPPGRDADPLIDAAHGRVIGAIGSAPDTAAMLDHARASGGPALRATGFHDRARMLKALASALQARREELHALSLFTGATRADGQIDIEGGIATLFAYAARGRRELPDGDVLVEGGVETLSRAGSFQGLHICTPLQGVALHINAFNFPVWGMLEKLGPTLLAGMPAIVKPARATGYVTAAAVRIMLETGVLPEGAVQLLLGPAGDMLDRLTGQDVVSFTGSADTALTLRANRTILRRGTRFVAEQDSLNATILGPDAAPGTPEFDLCVAEVVREMTAKAGQKCTAIRRILAPRAWAAALEEAVAARLATVRVGDPARPDTMMGALVSRAQRADVLDKRAALAAETQAVWGDPDRFVPDGADPARGAFLPPMLLTCPDPDGARAVHEVEAFGPIATVLATRDLDHAIALANRGDGSLALSLFSADPAVAARVARGAGAFHGRIYVNNRVSAAEATGHGAPLPHLVHGGPGRAGGGEEMGGIRGVMHYMQRTAIQGSPDVLTAVGGTWVPGAAEIPGPAHPFTRPFEHLAIGETIRTPARTVTLADIEHFAAFTGDRFYAHMDEAAAAANPFFPGRVAHGYLLLAFAAGLFVEPSPGPVLANTGLDALRFLKPVQPGDTIAVRLSVMRKTRRTDTYGEVRWSVTLMNQDGETVATYELLTMNAYAPSDPRASASTA